MNIELFYNFFILFQAMSKLCGSGMAKHMAHNVTTAERYDDERPAEVQASVPGCYLKLHHDK
jgi:hypothetical protein